MEKEIKETQYKYICIYKTSEKELVLFPLFRNIKNSLSASDIDKVVLCVLNLVTQSCPTLCDHGL